MTEAEETALKEQIESLKETVEKTTKETAGLQSLIGKWSSEIGGLRDQVKGIEGGDELKSKLESVAAEIKELKAGAQPPNGGQPIAAGAASGGQSGGKTPEELADELELSLDDEQKKLVIAAYNDLTDKTWWEDPKNRVAAYKEAKAQVKSVPDDPWRARKEQPQKTSLDKQVKELFDNAKRKATRVPPGSGGVGSSQGTTAQEGGRFDGVGSFGDWLKARK